MEYPKIALKGDGTLEMGEKIITKLKSLGGSNSRSYGGNSDSYYYIDGIGNINVSNHPPEKYKLVTLEQKQKLFKLI